MPRQPQRSRATAILAVAGQLLLCSAASFCHAEAAQPVFPSKAIRFIVAGPPGGSLDVIARVLQERLRATFDQPVVIENRPAAGGTVAANEVANSAADGHTWLLGFNGPLAFAPHLYTSLPYQPLRDLQPVVLTTAQPNLIAVNAAFPARDIASLISAWKAAPGKASYASVGNGSSSHLTVELLKSLTGTEALHVPFNGGGLPAMQAIISGDVQMIATVPTALSPHIAAGKLRAIAVTGKSRYALLPDIPTVRESGVTALRDFEATAWNGVLVAAGTPKPLVTRINTALNKALRDDAVRTRLRAAGLEIVGGSPERFGQLIAEESAKWAPVIKATGAKLD